MVCRTVADLLSLMKDLDKRRHGNELGHVEDLGGQHIGLLPLQRGETRVEGL